MTGVKQGFALIHTGRLAPGGVELRERVSHGALVLGTLNDVNPCERVRAVSIWVLLY
jgi:hypothetical protein